MHSGTTFFFKYLICGCALCIIQTDANSQAVPHEASKQSQSAANSGQIEALRDEIYKEIAALNSRPVMVPITPTTKNLEYARYYSEVSSRIEAFGTSNFPEMHGKKLYGTLVVAIPIWQDGTIYQIDGGPKVEKGSGNADLDAAALQIVRRAAPFPSFNEKIPGSQRGEIRLVVCRFEFAHIEDSDTPTGASQVSPNLNHSPQDGKPVFSQDH